MADENLRIRISAIDNTKKAFSAVTKGLGAVKNAVLSAKTAILALVGAGGFGYLIKRSIDASDTLAKTATKIGTTTEALSRLRYAADISGVSTQTLDMAMQRFTRRLAEAAQGTGEAKGALRELGIDAKAFLRLPLDEQMVGLSAAFANAATDADRVRLAMKLFDSEGVALVNTLKLGEKGMRDLMNEADTLGIVLSSKSAKGVEDTKDALTRLSYLAKGLTDQFTAALAPAIEYLATALKDWTLSLVDSEGGIEAFAKGAAQKFLKGVRTIVVGAAKAANEINRIFQTMSDPSGLTSGINTLRADRASFMAEAKRELEYLEGLRAGNREFRTRDMFKTMDEAINASTNRLNNWLEKISEIDNKLAYGQKPKNIADIFNIVGLEGIFDGLDYEIESSKGKLEEWKGTVANLGEEMSPFQEKLAEIKEGFKKAGLSAFDFASDALGFANNSINTVTDGLMNLMNGTMSAAKAFKSMAGSIIQDLMRMWIRYMIVKPLFDWMTGGVTGGQTQGITMDTTRGFGNVTNVAANGGSVSAGQGTIVGEHGAEYFVPRVNGAIINNRDLQGGGGVTVNQSINISAGVAQTVRAEIMGLMPAITNATKAAVADARMRGGSYSKSLVGA